MTCRYDRETGDYLKPDDTPCRVDDYGDPTRHCTTRSSCSNHVGANELTCPRCIARTRRHIQRIIDLAPLMGAAAIDAGVVSSEPANLAGPAADAEAWSWLKVAAKQGIIWHASLLEDDDDYHPYTVLTRWEFMLREDYQQPRIGSTSTTDAGEYLLRNLYRIAQEPTQDFSLLAKEVRRCAEHLELVLRNSFMPERGAPCPDCRDDGRVVRMTREYGHWCDDPDCERIHYSDTTGDRWVCPVSRDHWRSHEDYTRWVEERKQVGA